MPQRAIHRRGRHRGHALRLTTLALGLQAAGMVWAQQSAPADGPAPAAAPAAPAASASATATAAAELPAVTVRATSDNETATSPVFGFVAKRSATATKTDTPVMETPQSITVITRDRIEAQGAQSVQQAIGYTAGVHAGLYGNDNRGDWGRFRGTDFTQYQDGLLNAVGYYNNVRPDVYALERIDVLRGPSSMLFGQGAVGGILNLVSKRPQAEAAREIGVQFGNNNRKQVQADLTGPLDADGKWLYRLVALARDSDTHVDFAQDNRYLIAPSLTYRPNSDTSFTLLANFQRDDSNTTAGFFPWQGMLYPNPGGLKIRDSLFVSEPGFDRFKAEQAAIGYQFEHKANEVFTFRQNLRYSYSTVDYRSIYARFNDREGPWVAGSDRLLKRTVYWDNPRLRSFLVDTQAQAKFRTGSVGHTLLTGMDYQHADIDGSRGAGGSAAPIDIVNPVYGNYVAPTLNPVNPTKQIQTGIYMQDQMSWNQWLLMVGLRYDWSRASQVNTPASSRDDNELTKRFGLMYQTDFGLNPYISYSESFQGVPGNNRAGPLKPLRGKQWEAGIKYQPPGKNAMVTMAVFDMREKNRRASGIVNGVADTVQIGEARTRGFEIEALASLRNRVDLIANYTYLDTRILGGNSVEVGKRIASIPKHMASLWGTYKFNLFDKPGFSAGAGVRYFSASYDGTDRNKVGSATLVDAVLAYDHGPVRVALNVNNLFDKEYLTTCLARGDCYFGARRTVVGSVTYRF